MSLDMPPSSLPRAARLRLALAAGACLLLAGCDYLGLQPVSQIEARREAEGRAIGGACRQAGRALEDCYAFNTQISKASIFAGWRDMNDYMTTNNLSVIRPEVVPPLPPGRTRNDASGSGLPQSSAPSKAAALGT